jgi:hypothetical protein
VKTLKSHIALLLLGIFTFPIVFQPFHLLQHQSTGACFEHLCCQTEAAVKVTLPGIHFESQDKEECPVCEYDFAVKDLPGSSLFRTFTPVTHRSLKKPVNDLAFPQVYSTKTPRAPPLFAS